MPKQIPHSHRCIACPCSWTCVNIHCTDNEGQWCGNHCKNCASPPPEFHAVSVVEAAGHELWHAAYLLQSVGEKALETSVRALHADLIRKAQELSKGVTF